MWSEHEPYWRMFVPPAKLVSTDDPPIDADMFKPNAKDSFKLPGKQNLLGKINILIADSWREDVDCFEAACGALRIAESIKGARIHFWGVEAKADSTPVGAWEEVFSRLRKLGALGHVFGRMPHMEVVYRAMDFVLCPHRICVRVMGEALASGVPVLSERGCRYTPYQASFNDPNEILSSATRLLVDLRRDGKNVKKACRQQAVDKFSLPVFGAKLGKIYEAVLAK
jgi:glycosyltransferase involved in cell wall biosynthesis